MNLPVKQTYAIYRAEISVINTTHKSDMVINKMCNLQIKLYNLHSRKNTEKVPNNGN